MTDLEKIVEAMGTALIRSLNTRKGFRHIIDDLDDELLADVKAELGAAAWSAALGAMPTLDRPVKVVEREPSELMLSRIYENRHDWARGAYSTMWDAAPTAPKELGDAE